MNCENITSWITAIASVISSIAILFAYRIYKGDHERSRRENAVSLIGDWSRGLKQNASVAKKFAESLSPENIIHLWKEEPFEVTKDKEPLIRACLSGRSHNADLKIEGDLIYLELGDVSTIRWLVVTYLNQLESILSAWRNNVADREIIEEELNYLVTSDSKEILKDFRNVEDSVNSFPAIDEFVKLLHPKTKFPNQGKSKI